MFRSTVSHLIAVLVTAFAAFATHAQEPEFDFRDMWWCCENDPDYFGPVEFDGLSPGQQLSGSFAYAFTEANWSYPENPSYTETVDFVRSSDGEVTPVDVSLSVGGLAFGGGVSAMGMPKEARASAALSIVANHGDYHWRSVMSESWTFYTLELKSETAASGTVRFRYLLSIDHDHGWYTGFSEPGYNGFGAAGVDVADSSTYDPATGDVDFLFRDQIVAEFAYPVWNCGLGCIFDEYVGGVEFVELTLATNTRYWVSVLSMAGMSASSTPDVGPYGNGRGSGRVVVRADPEIEIPAGSTLAQLPDLEIEEFTVPEPTLASSWIAGLWMLGRLARRRRAR